MAFTSINKFAQRVRLAAVRGPAAGPRGPLGSPARPVGLLLLAALLIAAPVCRVAAAPAAAAGTALPAPAVAAAAAASFTMEEAVAAALERSATVVDARASVESASLDLGLSAPWRSSSLSGRASLAPARLPADTAPPELSWNLQASAPLLTGLSLDASLSATSVSAGASVKPFATANVQPGEALKRALIQAAEAERQAAIQARNAYRSAWLAMLSLAMGEKSLAAAEARAEATTLNAAAGAATASEVIDADSKRIDAMVGLLDAKDLAITTLSALSRLVGRTVSAAELVEPDPGADRVPQTEAEYLAAASSLASLGLDLAAAERSAKPVMPNLSLGGSIDQPLDQAGATPAWSVTASVSIDPDTFLRGQDRASALDLSRARRKAAESRTDAVEEHASLVARIASARSALESAERIATTARLAFEKNSFLAEAGTVSGASLLDSEVSRMSAEYRVAKARADLGAALDALDGSFRQK